MNDTPAHGYARRSRCPCCGTASGIPSPTICSTPAAEDLPPEQHTSFVSGYGARRVFFSYHRCGSCGVMYCPVFYSPSQLLEHYQHQAENMGNVPLAARERTQAGYASLLMEHSSKAGGFLEIGSDIGLFAEACARKGTFDRLWLHEPNLDVHDELKRRLAPWANTVSGSMWPSSDIPPGSVSTAALIHVLDHLLEPREYLDAMRNCLEPGGVMLTITHNAASMLARVLGRRFPPYALQHPQLYTPASISTLFRNSGFDVVTVVAATNHFPVLHLVRGGMEVLGMGALAPVSQGPIVPIRLGNMAVIARRRA